MISFNWVLRNKLAGSSQPGLYDDTENDIDFLKNNGINTIISLTESIESYEEYGMKQIHFPIPDMGIPSPRSAYSICTKIVDEINDGNIVLVHCKAGLGRTGTILACCLINLGRSHIEAISEIRRINKAYIQNALQEKFIEHYYDFAVKEYVL